MSTVALSDYTDELHKRNTKGYLNVGVGVDGSVVSDRAFELALAFCDVKRKDRLSILHISDSSKTYLPRHLQPTNLSRFYEDKAFMSHVHSDWNCIDKSTGASTCETLTNLAEQMKVDILVLGSIGRKGEKMDVLGSVADYSLRKSHASICIVRASSSNVGKHGLKYLFSSDGSHAARLAFIVLLSLLYKPGDTVDVVMVSNSAGGQDYQHLLNEHRTMLEEKKIPGECCIKAIPSVQGIADGILDFAFEKQCDILVLGISGYGKKKLGSVSEIISLKALCTTILIKDSYEVADHRYQVAGSKALMDDITPTGRKSRMTRAD